MREVTVLAAGGTISSVEGASGQPRRDPAARRRGARRRACPAPVRVEARTLRAVNGPQLTNDDALALAREAVAETERGRGVVLTSGTDTIEEVAVLCDALAGDGPADRRDRRDPARLRPGRRRPGQPPRRRRRGRRRRSPRGPAAWSASPASCTPPAPSARSTPPRRTRSPRRAAGRSAAMAEGRVELFARPLRGPRLPVPDVARLQRRRSSRPGWATTASCCAPRSARRPTGSCSWASAPATCRRATLAALREAAADLPVVFVVRPERGHLLRATYGYEGSERDVLATGVVAAAGLSGPAARMLLLAALGCGLTGDALRSPSTRRWQAPRAGQFRTARLPSGTRRRAKGVSFPPARCSGGRA